MAMLLGCSSCTVVALRGVGECISGAARPAGVPKAFGMGGCTLALCMLAGASITGGSCMPPFARIAP
ncbi:hypothetical protein G6F51_014549 [Rhizopus arrhizus]|uniref:Uncharacterized protein n=1 Tax=Rhizopus oryzae TaxID=64495 RepID=A0A9P6XLP8_RHIOR|nr:hypothetical protein G6F51_014549 [Rhizopus arrhizus]